MKIFSCLFAILSVLGASVHAKASKSSKSSKPSKSKDDFLVFAERELERINDAVCADENLADFCTQIEGLVMAGQKYSGLPKWYYLNYRAMTIAYPLLSLLQLAPNNQLVQNMNLDTHRVHRTLGLGNMLRIQGYGEDDVDDAYWSQYGLLTIGDSDLQDPRNGIEQYCKYIAQEYEMLKAFAVDKYNTTYDTATFEVTSIETGTFYQLCANGSKIGSWLVRIDWEQHRSEVIGSLMDMSVTEELVAYTIWHWESLFAALTDPTNTIPTLFKSFDALLPFAE